MRALAVLPKCPPASRAGAFISTFALLADLAARGHTVTCVQQHGHPARARTRDGVRVLTGAAHIETTLNAGGVDVVVAHLGDSGRAQTAAEQAGVPVVLMAHGGPVDEDRANRADLVVWNSHTYRDERAGIVVHPPVDPDQYRVTPGDRVTLVNCSKAKGVMTFWRAAEQLPDIGFLAVASGIGQQITPRAANIDVIPRPVADMRDVYRRTRLLLIPSETETWGRVGVEALVSGIPVIAHPTPGLVESLGAAGTFVDRADTAGWAAAIRSVLDNWDTHSARALTRSGRITTDFDGFEAALQDLTTGG